MATTQNPKTDETLQQTKGRVFNYTDMVSADVNKASNGLKHQLEQGAKHRLKLS